ncbi:hypothetical protein [Hymenobacter jeollabukensis]|uniref:Uncharacterized protein n=1 Tax=Hymenobacter jeollabukensis TaxID=2025313 RepID=A0A5R8WKQ6_9BACT|nr:hypothetical protein [Hymenobacter jeollabukensis]TLM89470.1 hypothetical protein FDY95_20575 [Hymenobacter jeollabukensis]
MTRRPLEARLTKALGRRSAGPLDLPDYASRRCRRTKEYRLARLLSGWPALIEEEPMTGLNPEPMELPALREAA